MLSDLVRLSNLKFVVDYSAYQTTRFCRLAGRPVKA